MTAYQGRFQPRRGTAAQWQSSNTILALSELGYDSDADRYKSGDGVTGWNSLGWVTGTPFVPPPSTGWTAMNSGVVTDNVESRVTSLVSAAGGDWRGEVRTLSPASNYTATFYFDWTSPGINFSAAAIILKNSATNSLVTHGISWDTTNQTGWNVKTAKWSNFTTSIANYNTTNLNELTNGLPHWLRIRDDSVTRYSEYSYNGIDWVLHHSVGRTDNLTPDQIGWANRAKNDGGTYTSITRLRHFTLA